ncbi:response regulator [Falsiroseomonas sp. CW058]|uniref:response regulator n=1 Tax=Falsiroseomonas sp. CW058 TaxID=3388664 RepID=UPI003D3113C5
MNLPLGFATTSDQTTPAAAAPGTRQLLLDATTLSTPVAPRLAVLVVDDEEEVRDELAEMLERRGMAVLTANSAQAALGVLRGRADVGALVTDIRMPGMDGLTLAEHALDGRGPAEALEVVLVTGYVTPGYSLAANRLGAFGMLQKPMRGAELGRMLEEALDRAAARRRAALVLVRPDPLPAPPLVRSPAEAAEALLHTLSQRLAGPGAALEATAREMREPLAALLEAGPAEPTDQAETRRLLALVDDLLEVAALEAGTLAPDIAPISAHGLLGALCARLDALGLRCGRRIILQPEADPAFLLDTARLVRAVALLAARALRDCDGAAQAEVSVDAGGGQARIDLTIRPVRPVGGDAGEPSPGQLLPVSIARRMVALQGGRLDAWTLPEGGLRARLLIRGA